MFVQLDDGTEMMCLTHLRGELCHLVRNPNALVAVSKRMQAAKVCTNKILQFVTSGVGGYWLTC